MGLPQPCAVAYLLRNTWSHPFPAGGPEKGSELCPHGTDRKESGILAAMIMVRQGPLGPALSKTDVDCVEGLAALLPNSLSAAWHLPCRFLPQHLSSAPPTQGNQDLAAHKGMRGPNTEAPQTVVKAHSWATVLCWTVLGLGKLPSQTSS